MKMTFFKCPICGQVIATVNKTGAEVICCGEPMKEIIPGNEDASLEKHVPVYEIKDNVVHVMVGSELHPMINEHYIEWIAIETKFGNQRKVLNPGEEPVACFALCDGDEIENVYAYCNIHSLWETD